MAVTSATDQQIIVNKSGNEINPVSIVIKNALWLVYSRFRKIVVKEYLGTAGSKFISDETDYFTVSNALDTSGSVSTTKFWLWTVENKSLYFTEIEPVIGGSPIIGSKILVQNPISTVSINVFGASEIRALMLDSTADFGQELFLNLYPTPGGPASRQAILQWGPTRLNTFISLFSRSVVEAEANENLLFTYLDTASPPSVYLEEYLEVGGPTITSFTFSYVNGVPTLCWSIDNAEDPVGRVMEITPNVGAITETSGCMIITSAVDSSYTLYVSTPGGSDTETVFPLVIDYSASVYSGPSPLCVEFTDISILPSNFVVTNRIWVFGDGTSAQSTGLSICHEYEGLFGETFTPSLILTISEQILNLSFNESGDYAEDVSSLNRNYQWTSGVGGSNTFISSMLPDGGHALIESSATGYYIATSGISPSADLGIGAGAGGSCSKDLVFKFAGSFPNVGTSADAEIMHISDGINFFRFKVRSTGVIEFRWKSALQDVTYITSAIATSGSFNDPLAIQTVIFHLTDSGSTGQFYYGLVTGDIATAGTGTVTGTGTPSQENVIGYGSDINISHLQIESGPMNLTLAREFHNGTVRGIV